MSRFRIHVWPAAPALMLAFVLAAPLRADGLSDLKARLGTLKGSEPLKASVERQIWNRSGDEKKPVVVQGRATAWVEESPQGIKLFWSRDQVQQAAQENRAKDSDPEKTAPTRQAISSLDVPELDAYFNSADMMLQNLNQATLLGESADTLNGAPVRVLSLKIEPRLSQQDRKYIKELSATAKVWIDSEGLPLAAEQSIQIKGRALMVISFKSEQKDEYRFLRIGNRLVTLRHQHEGSGSGGGESGQEKRVTILKYN